MVVGLCYTTIWNVEMFEYLYVMFYRYVMEISPDVVLAKTYYVAHYHILLFMYGAVAMTLFLICNKLLQFVVYWITENYTRRPCFLTRAIVIYTTNLYQYHDDPVDHYGRTYVATEGMSETQRTKDRHHFRKIKPDSTGIIDGAYYEIADGSTVFPILMLVAFAWIAIYPVVMYYDIGSEYMSDVVLIIVLSRSFFRGLRSNLVID